MVTIKIHPRARAMEATVSSARGVEMGVERGVEKLTVTEETIITLIRKTPSISKKEITTQGHLSKKAVDYNINKLKGKGLLRRIGPDKVGHWEVTR